MVAVSLVSGSSIATGESDRWREASLLVFVLRGAGSTGAGAVVMSSLAKGLGI